MKHLRNNITIRSNLGVPAVEEDLVPTKGVVGVLGTRAGKPLGLGVVEGAEVVEGVLMRRGVLRLLATFGEAAVGVLDIRLFFSISKQKY